MINSFTGESRFLSNFYPAWVTLGSDRYSTVEHAYQAAKTLNASYREAIRKCATPGAAKKMGRHIPLRAEWESVKEAVMSDLLEEKFRNPILRQKLLDTGDKVLEEGNQWGDTYWGVCKGKGRNRLGVLLMTLRERIREGK